MDNSLETVKRKVCDMFFEMVGERANRLDGSVVSATARSAVTAALVGKHGPKRATEIALHITDWNWDAAFIVALHLFPDRFKAEEIDAGIGLFLTHAPNHIREACRLTGQYVWEDFPEDE